MDFQDREYAEEDEDLFEQNLERNGEKRRKKSAALYDPMLLEELEDVFHDAHEYIVSSFAPGSTFLHNRGRNEDQEFHLAKDEERKEGTDALL